MSREFTIEAKTENMPDIIKNIEQAMRDNGWTEDRIINYVICIEEIFVNIASYAYTNSVGKVEIIEDISENRVSHTFIDEGIPYNPLEKPDPDITLSAEERGIGGLGIFMVKQMMSDVDYSYSDGKNHFMMALDRE